MPDVDAQAVVYQNEARTVLSINSRALGGDWNSPVNLLANYNASWVSAWSDKQFVNGYLLPTSFKDGPDWVFAVVSIDNQGSYRLIEIARSVNSIDKLDVFWGENDQIYAMYVQDSETWLSYGHVGAGLTHIKITNRAAFEGGFFSAQSTSDGSLGFYYYSDKEGDTYSLSYLYLGRVSLSGELSVQDFLFANAWDSYSTQDQDDTTHFTFFNLSYDRFWYLSVSVEGDVLDFQEITPEAPGIDYTMSDFSRRLPNGDLLIAWRQNAAGENAELYIRRFNVSERQWSQPLNLYAFAGVEYLEDVVVLPTGLLINGSGFNDSVVDDERRFSVHIHLSNEDVLTSVDIGSTHGENSEETGSCIAGNDAGQAVVAWNKRAENDTGIYVRRYSAGSWGQVTKIGESAVENPSLNCAMNGQGNIVLSWGRWLHPWYSDSDDVNTLEYAHYLAAEDYWSPTVELLSKPFAYVPAYLHATTDGFILNWRIDETHYAADIGE